jgi:CDP-paratose synthetase
MRILLTGPSGFLGTALVQYWARRGHELCLLARPDSNLLHVEGLPPTVRVRRTASPKEVVAAVRETAPNVIVHTAGAYGRMGETPLDLLNSNVIFGMLLLQAVISEPVTGMGQTVFLNTGTVLAPDVSLYALSKTQFSAWGVALAKEAPTNLRFIDVRLEHIYGPGDDRSKFTTNVIEACRNNEPTLALTLGEQRRDLIYIDDVVQAYDLILRNQASFASSDSIDVGSGTAHCLREVVEMIKRLTNSSTELDFGAIPYRANETMHSVADISRLSALGWRPAFNLEAGIRQILNLELSK